ncbi:hypothetical protein [Arthrobacter livingstonensis]|nr:hypothetical protein [Arthrobacter livingstonensis]
MKSRNFGCQVTANKENVAATSEATATKAAATRNRREACGWRGAPPRNIASNMASPAITMKGPSAATLSVRGKVSAIKT